MAIRGACSALGNWMGKPILANHHFGDNQWVVSRIVDHRENWFQIMANFVSIVFFFCLASLAALVYVACLFMSFRFHAGSYEQEIWRLKRAISTAPGAFELADAPLVTLYWAVSSTTIFGPI